jgi:hypothetical protein
MDLWSLLTHRIDSMLLIVSGSRNERGEGLYHYKWDGKRLALIKNRLLKEPMTHKYSGAITPTQLVGRPAR